MRKLKFAFILTALAVFPASLLAQAKKPTFSEKLYLGGHLSFKRGRINQNFEVAPSIGYYWNIHVVTGLSFYALGSSTRGNFLGEPYESKYHMWGGGIFGRYYLDQNKVKTINGLFLHSEVEYLRGKESYKEKKKDSDRLSTHTLLLGAGYKKLIGERFAITTSLMFALADDPVYSNPIVRIGFEF